MKQYSTREAATKLGLDLTTVQRYIAAGKIPVPPIRKFGGGKFRVWTEKDIENVQRILPKIANGRKTRYQKLREKKTSAGVPVPHKKRRTKRKK